RPLRAAYQHRAQPARSHALLQAIVDGGADLPNRKAPALDPADLPQARRHYPRPRVLQLPRAGAEEGAGGPHRGARSLRFLAADHRRPRLADRDRNRARRQALRGSLGAAFRRQPRSARRWRGSVQNLSHFRLAERRPALAHAVMAPLICWSFSNSMFRYLLVDHAVPAMWRSLAAARLSAD